MEILNIGIIELVFILLLMLVLLGPEGMIHAARSIAVFVRKFLKSPIWSELMRVNQDFQEMPTRLMREAGIDEIKKEIASTERDMRENVRGMYSWEPHKAVEMPEPTIAPPTKPSPVQTEENPAVEPPLAETPRQIYRRSTAALRKTRQQMVYPREVILPSGSGREETKSRQDHP